jgi:hypothetical protein
MRDENKRESVESSEASAKKEMWLRDGSELIRLASRADSPHDVRGALDVGWSSGSNMVMSMMMDLSFSSSS